MSEDVVKPPVKKRKPGHKRTMKMKTVNVKVISENGHGSHPKGAILPMHKSTAEACIKSGVVEKSGKW